MEKNLLNSNSPEQSLHAATQAAVIPPFNGVEEIVIFDECGDTMWDKVLAQHELANTISRQLPG